MTGIRRHPGDRSVRQVVVNPPRDELLAAGDELILIGQDENLDQLRG